jgi:hypothetical protein
MSIDPGRGPAYQYPDSVPEPEFAGDRGFEAPPQNPGGGEVGPIHFSPEARDWIKQNVIDQDYVIDWGTREIIDPETGEVKGTVPTEVPRMV